MSQFGDGGLLGSKPYISSGAYIDRMSDYCGKCRYDVKQRVGENACPYNALYWDFLVRHEDKLGGNMRLRMPYSTWAKQSEQSQKETLAQAATFLQALDTAGEDGY
jgi:deoxyribodipyrimidine photolyase-related protein